ncbi:MAG: hypothetical protein M3N19_05150 [Candidatus Eremiobacteraeota bacterium]|nr:hypothetical protein [Candidatus Eremiobacteraeota bacterium]
MKKKRLHSPNAVRYATIAVIITGVLACGLGVRDSLSFGQLQMSVFLGAILIVGGAAVLALTYKQNLKPQGKS